mmetsp:Transcript_21653/g.31366  ORF Transcript_21653/g.31366 Transcript_21653/m.31366 type:complete len:99 (+) Transcript_21653:81-377(+)
MIGSAIARSRPMMAPRHDVSSFMVKWWKGRVPNDGQITKTLSPYEQQIIMPWLRTWPKRAYEKFMGSFIYWGGAGGIVIGTAILSDAADAAEDFSHRF